MSVENNKLIALFMGAKTSGLGLGEHEIWIPIHGVCDCRVFDNGKTLKYHASWDWLIPVIDKIHSSDEYALYKDTLGQFFHGVTINTKFIEVTYDSVVEYIKWYNQRKVDQICFCGKEMKQLAANYYYCTECDKTRMTNDK